MARYRKASGKRVGRDTPPLSLNPFPTPAPTTPPVVGSAASGISERLLGAGIILKTESTQLLAGADLYATLTTAQKSALAQQLKKFGYVSRTNDQLKSNLEAYFSDAFNNSRNFSSLMTAVQAEYIPGLDGTGGPSTTQTVTNYDPIVLDKLIESIYQTTIGRKPTAEEITAKRSVVDNMVKAGTTTTSKKVGGKTVTTVTPGFSQERATAVISEGIKKENVSEYKQQQSFDFMDWLTKNAAGA